MIELKLSGPQRDLEAALRGRFPTAPWRMPNVKRKVLDYQLIALHGLAEQFAARGRDAAFLEIGSGHGGSGYVIARAAPEADFLSLTSSPKEALEVRRFWDSCGIAASVDVRLSWNLLAEVEAAAAARSIRDEELLDFVFVDGDHNRVARDLPWFNYLRPGGLVVFHDYSPQDSRTPSGVVYETLNRVRDDVLRRDFDVLLVDEGKVGMAGWYRRDGEVLVP